MIDRQPSSGHAIRTTGRTIRDQPVTHARAAPDYRALAEVRHQIRCFLTFSEGRARAAGIESQQHQLLLAIKGLAPGLRPTISVLAERMLLRHHTVVGLVDRLVHAGLALRLKSPDDGREILLRITPRGERLLRTLSIAHQAELSTAGPALVHALERVLAAAKTRSRMRRQS
jgi:DNA-binding MarR family transcriptional regulator